MLATKSIKISRTVMGVIAKPSIDKSPDSRQTGLWQVKIIAGLWRSDVVVRGESSR
jgi:hypothetical protein